jgi:diguanylate cyclase (GGDEF)-like protein/PAS domain S-box-containing protein
MPLQNDGQSEGASTGQIPVEDGYVFRTLLDKMTDGVIVAQDYRFIFANPAMHRMLGYAHDEFIGIGFDAVVAPEFLGIWNERFRQRIGEGEEPLNTYEVRFLCKGGQDSLPVELNANRVTFGGRRAVLCIIRDISRRRYIEQALRDSELRFRGTFEQAAVGIAVLDLDGRWEMVNGKLCGILGYSEDELRNRTFQDITHPDDLQTDLQYVEQLLRGDISNYSMEKRYLHKDGQAAWARLTVSLLYDTENQPSHFIAVIEDIHNQRMAQTALADSELRHRLLMHNLHAGILICAPDARILYANPEASRMLRLDAGTMAGLKVADIGCEFADEHGNALSADTDLVRRVLMSGREMKDLVISITHPDVTERGWVLVHAYPEFDTSSRFKQIVVMLIDITDRQRLEAELEADRKLKAAALDAMTAHVAVLDKRGQIVETNASWRKFALRSQYAGDPTFLGVNYLDALSRVGGPDQSLATQACEGILSVMLGRSPLFQMDYPCHCPAERQWFSLKVTPMDPQRERVLVSHENITAIKLAEEAIRILANTDALTGLPNRRHFFETAEEEFARAQRYETPLAVLMVDLDNFKSFNDQYGHAGGDAVLRSFALVLSGLLRDSDSAGRIGGEEFAVILPHTSLDGACAFAERLMERIAANPPDIDGQPAPYTLSVGVSEMSPASKDFSALLILADKALYRAKQSGRNRLVVLTGGDSTHPGSNAA